MGFRATEASQIIERAPLRAEDELCRIQVAALPWREAGEDVEIMLITSRDTGRWVLPKGWPEQREKLYEAAAREASEEAGIEGSQGIAIALNGRVLRRKDWAETTITPGDRIEIVRAMQGG